MQRCINRCGNHQAVTLVRYGRMVLDRTDAWPQRKGSRIRDSRRRSIEKAGHPIKGRRQQSVGDIRQLGRKFWSVLPGNRYAVGPHESQVFPILGQCEIRVQTSFRVGFVLARGKHDKVFGRTEFHVRKSPLPQIVAIVRERPPLELDWIITRVVDLDPVG